jgi:glycosyltransferase involved in cell wall biosynthesis
VLGSLARISRRHKIDLIYTIAHSNTMVLADIARRLGLVRRVVVSIHSTGSNKGGRLFRPFVRPFIRGVDRFVSVAEKHKRYLVDSEGLDADRITVIHNGVDTTAYHPRDGGGGVRDGLGIGPGEKVVISIARLRPVKRIDLLLRAAQGVLAEAPDTRFLLVGGGDREPYEQLARDLGIARNVTFAGERDDVPELLRMSDVFVLSSRTEAFPNVVLEAMATGLPVVATDVGSISEMVEDGASALLVPRENAGALRDGLIALLSDAERAHAFGERGRAIVEKRFGIVAMCTKRAALFDALLCGETR